MDRVAVRTPTFRRPEALKRALESLQLQTWPDWTCDVYDDDREGSAADVIESLHDDRIAYHRNEAQLFASKNIDQCFTKRNPRDAEWFCVVEDDNFLLPRFMEDNISVAKREGVNLVLRNQLIEFNSGRPDASISELGIQDGFFKEKVYSQDEFRLSLLGHIGVSNGGLFWSRNAASDLEIGFDCSATLQEYLRTMAIVEPIFVGLESLAVWAHNGEDTLRDLGSLKGNLASRLSLAKSLWILRRAAWSMASRDLRADFLTGNSLVTPAEKKLVALAKSHIFLPESNSLPKTAWMAHLLRGAVSVLFGQPEICVRPFMKSLQEAR
jgi:hypothetical protein